MINDVQRLIDAIKKAHGCDAEHIDFVRIRQTLEGRTVWNGIIEIFSVPRSTAETERCFAWSVPASEAQQAHYVTVLAAPPIDTPLKAIEAFLVSELRKGAAKKQNPTSPE